MRKRSNSPPFVRATTICAILGARCQRSRHISPDTRQSNGNSFDLFYLNIMHKIVLIVAVYVSYLKKIWIHSLIKEICLLKANWNRWNDINHPPICLNTYHFNSSRLMQFNVISSWYHATAIYVFSLTSFCNCKNFKLGQRIFEQRRERYTLRHLLSLGLGWLDYK